MAVRALDFRWKCLDRKLSVSRVVFYDCDPHFHETFTVALVRKGSIELTVNDHRYPLEEGDVFIIHPYQVHGGGNKSQAVECDILYPSIDFMSRIVGKNFREGSYPYFGGPVIKSNKLTRQLFHAIDHTYRPRDILSDGDVYEAFCKLFGPRMEGKRHLSLVEDYHPAVFQACDVIYKDLEKISNFSHLWQRLDISRYHFIRIFRKAVGLPPNAYIRQLRVAKARELITKGENLAKVAMEVGFYDQSHMTREFRNVYGYPPGRLAKEMREAQRRAS